MRAVLFVLIASTLCTCSGAPSLLEQIRSRGELNFVTRNSPTTFFLGSDAPQGIEYELARGFAERIGVELNLSTARQPWQIVPTLLDGSADIAATGLGADLDQTHAAVNTGPAYQHSLQQVIYRRGSGKPSGPKDLDGARIAIIADSQYSSSLESLQKDLPSLQWTEHSDASVEELVRRVAEGEFDYTLVDSNLFAILQQYHPEVRAAFSLSDRKPISWALPQHAPQLREAVSAYFAEISATGELQQLIDKYYAPARHFDYVGSRAFVTHSRTRLPAFTEEFMQVGRKSGFDWRLLAAIAYQESHWRPDAVSPTGVRGLMMLTEHTAAAVDVSDRTDPAQSIRGGAAYLQRMIDKLPARIPSQDRLWMALAAYNVGFGHLEDARIITQMNGHDPDNWSDVRRHLPLLADEAWHSRVRRGYARGDVPVLYVDNIRRYYQMLQWLDRSRPENRSENMFVIERQPREAAPAASTREQTASVNAASGDSERSL